MPAFLLAYYRGWTGVAVAMLAGMVVLAIVQVLVIVFQIPTNWVLRLRTRRMDLSARYGGEEFITILSAPTSTPPFASPRTSAMGWTASPRCRRSR